MTKLGLLPKILIWTASIGVVGYAGLNIAKAIPAIEPFVNVIPIVNQIPTLTGSNEMYCGIADDGKEHCVKITPQLNCIGSTIAGGKEECFQDVNEFLERQEYWENHKQEELKQNCRNAGGEPGEDEGSYWGWGCVYPKPEPDSEEVTRRKAECWNSNMLPDGNFSAETIEKCRNIR